MLLSTDESSCMKTLQRLQTDLSPGTSPEHKLLSGPKDQNPLKELKVVRAATLMDGRETKV